MLSDVLLPAVPMESDETRVGIDHGHRGESRWWCEGRRAGFESCIAASLLKFWDDEQPSMDVIHMSPRELAYRCRRRRLSRTRAKDRGRSKGTLAFEANVDLLACIDAISSSETLEGRRRAVPAMDSIESRGVEARTTRRTGPNSRHARLQSSQETSGTSLKPKEAVYPLEFAHRRPYHQKSNWSERGATSRNWRPT